MFEISDNDRNQILNKLGWIDHTLSEYGQTKNLRKHSTGMRTRVIDIIETVKEMRPNLNESINEEDETMRMMRNPENLELLSQRSLTEENDQAMMASGSNKRGPDEDHNTGPGKRPKNLEGSLIDSDSNELSHLAHAELESLRVILENDIAAKRITIAQRKELNGSYNRLLSIVRDMATEWTRKSAECEALKDKLNTLEEKVARQERLPAAKDLENEVLRRERPPATVGKSSTSDKTFGDITKSKNKVADKGTMPSQNKKVTFAPKKIVNKGTLATKKWPDKPRLTEFIIKTNGKNVPKTKADLWQELSRHGTPKIREIKVLKSGDMVIKPADEATNKNLRGVKLDGISIETSKSWKPRILVYDIERDTADTELPGIISRQNPDLGIKENVAADYIKPLFKKGPKNGDNVWWVMEVEPLAFKKLMEMKRIYIGYMLFKVTEFEEVTQCNKCQKFGHSGKFCRNEVPTCGWCAGSGHIKKDCPNHDKAPKCANCAMTFTAGHKQCVAKERALKFKRRHTDYCGPTVVGSSSQDD